MSSLNQKTSSSVMVIAIILLGLNLRPVLAGIGPLLTSIQSATGITNGQAGLLTTLPILAMGIFALLGKRIRKFIRPTFGIQLGMIAIFIACIIRVRSPDSIILTTTAALAGIGIALVQTLLPGFIKSNFGKNTDRVMGIYITAIMGGAAITSSISAWIEERTSWPTALAIWCIPAAIGWMIWAKVSRSSDQVNSDIVSTASLDWWKKPRAWTLVLFFGLGTSSYTLMLAWLPTYYVELGWSSSSGGLALGALSMVEVLAGLIVSTWIERFPDRRVPLFGVLSLILLGLVCLILEPIRLAVPLCIFLGLGIGALFPLSLILTLDHVKDPVHAGDLTGFVQGGGYMVASVMPFIAGYLRSEVGLGKAWIFLAAGIVLLIIINQRFSPASYAQTLGPVAEEF